MMKVNFDHKTVLREYSGFDQILEDYRPYTRNVYETYTDDGFLRYRQPDYSDKYFYYIGYCPENEKFSVHLYIPFGYLLADNIASNDADAVYEKYGYEEIRKVYEWRMSLIVKKYTCLGITDYRVEGDENGSPVLVCVIPAGVFGQEKIIKASCINDLDFKLEKQNDECPGDAGEKFRIENNRASVGYMYKEMSERLNPGTRGLFPMPNYSGDSCYYEFYSPAYRDFIENFWEFVDLAVLGSPASREYARGKICEMLYLNEEYEERQRRDMTAAQPEDDIVREKREDISLKKMSPKERQAAFSKFIDEKIGAVRASGDPEFSVKVLCDEKVIRLDPFYFSKVKNGGIKNPGRKKLLMMGIGLDLSPEEIAEMFRLKSMAYPTEPYEYAVNDAIKSGDYTIDSLLKLIPDIDKETGSKEPERE